jgi:hypothetical protein
VHQDRRRGKGSRVLYWFRTPPGVKVGRAALDEDAIRLLEEINPDVEFDWTRMLKAEPPPQEARAPHSSKGHPQQRRRDGGQRQAQPRRERDGERRAAPQAPPTEPQVDAEIDRREPVAEADAREDVITEPLTVDEILEPAPIAADTAREAPSLMPTAAQARLGTEGIVRLRGRYAEVLARIDERITDAVGREELKLQAERLNPDSWVTDEEVRVGLEQYESVFESLRAVVGRRRKRRRRRGHRPQPDTSVRSTEAENVDGAPDEASEPEESDDL